MSRDRPTLELERMVMNIKKARNHSFETREGLLLLARLSAMDNRFEHMFQYMKNLVKIVAPTKPLTDFERQCLCCACTYLLKGQLNSYRFVAKAITDSSGVNQRRADAAVDYLGLITLDICNTFSDVVGIIDICISPIDYSFATAASAESRVFYKKMKGDFLKYLAEVKKGAEREQVIIDALRTYMSAKFDEEVLPATHPTRLELKLSLALFYSEIRVWPSIAYSIASEAVDLAKREMEATGKIATEETALVLGCLQSGMNIWRK